MGQGHSPARATSNQPTTGALGEMWAWFDFWATNSKTAASAKGEDSRCGSSDPEQGVKRTPSHHHRPESLYIVQDRHRSFVSRTSSISTFLCALTFHAPVLLPSTQPGSMAQANPTYHRPSLASAGISRNDTTPGLEIALRDSRLNPS